MEYVSINHSDSLVLTKNEGRQKVVKELSSN